MQATAQCYGGPYVGTPQAGQGQQTTYTLKALAVTWAGAGALRWAELPSGLRVPDGQVSWIQEGGA